jgi:hypothetical protein
MAASSIALNAMLKISELIEILQTHPPDMRVVVDGYEGGYDDLERDSVSRLRICVNVRSSPSILGAHDDEGWPKDWPLKETALCLSR